MKHRIVGGLAFMCIAAASQPGLVAEQRGESVGRLERIGPPRTATGSSAIVGRVFDPNTNAPVRRAQIEASTRYNASVWTTSDDDGRFQLLNLSAGEWRVTASKGG